MFPKALAHCVTSCLRIRSAFAGELHLCYRTGFLSCTSVGFPTGQRTFSTHLGCRTLLGELYLFISYALRCLPALRNPVNYLGITLLIQILYTICIRVIYVFYSLMLYVLFYLFSPQQLSRLRRNSYILR